MASPLFDERIFGRLVAGLCLFLSLTVWAPRATGQVSDDQAAYETAFEAMQRDPGSSDKAFAYAQAAIKVGDLEGAIGALERLLIFNPDLPRIRLELGVLYYRLGSFELARLYLSQITDRSDIPADVRAKVDEYIAETDRLSAQHRITGSLLTGIRYQTNANTGPVNGISRIFGLDLTLSTDLQKKGDLNFFGAATVNYVYDFRLGDPLTLESNLTLYGAKQFKQTQYDLSLVQVDIGPRFGLQHLLDGASIRPYLIADHLSLGETNYLNSYGGGFNALAPLTDRLLLDGNFEVQNRQYWANTARPRIENRNGDFIAVRLSPRVAVTDKIVLSLTGELDRTLSVQGYERNTQFVLGPNALVRFDSPIPDLEQPWAVGFGFNRVWRTYAAADPIVDSDNTRRDSEWNVGGSLSVGLVDKVQTLFQIQRSWVDSTIPNYSYRNLIGSVALSMQF
jgi:tetratricopeptide (TPR) repeat protein